MAQVFDLNTGMDWSGLADAEVRAIPLVHYPNGMRVRVLVSRCGTWPQHVEQSAELYVVLAGEVVFLTDREQRVSAGHAILLAPGEPHGGRVEHGAVSINVDWAPT